MKNNENIEIANENWQSLDELGLTPGVTRFYSNIKVTKTKQIEGFNVAAKWKRKFKGGAPNEGWFILTFGDLPTAIKAYKKRFAIEEMFRDFQSGGYNARRH